MNRAYEGALFDPPKQLIDAMTNEPKDRHVLACAVGTQASVIVTFNVADFPAAACDPYDIEVQHPDVFAEHLVTLNPEAARNAITEMSDRTSQPHRTVQAIVKRLAHDMPKAIARL